MMSVMSPVACVTPGNPFDPEDDRAYRVWRDAKLADMPRRAADLIVDVGDPVTGRFRGVRGGGYTFRSG